MSKPIATDVYNLYGRFYDHFQSLFRQRLAAAIGALALQPGQRVLDLGIGTGLSLDFYPPGVHVVGIDLSAGMLDQAARKLRSGLARPGVAPRLTDLIQGDALALPFAAGSFDAVFISHVLTTVPEPCQALREALRVARDPARLALVNHFKNPRPPLAWFETAIDPLCRRLGWRSDLTLAGLLEPLGVTGVRHPGGLLFQTVFLEQRSQQLRLVEPPAMKARAQFKPSFAS